MEEIILISSIVSGFTLFILGAIAIKCRNNMNKPPNFYHIKINEDEE